MSQSCSLPTVAWKSKTIRWSIRLAAAPQWSQVRFIGYLHRETCSAVHQAGRPSPARTRKRAGVDRSPTMNDTGTYACTFVRLPLSHCTKLFSRMTYSTPPFAFCLLPTISSDLVTFLQSTDTIRRRGLRMA